MYEDGFIMIISNKQIMQLLECAHGLLNRMVEGKEDQFFIQKVNAIIDEIGLQQSGELREINDDNQ